MDVAGSDKFANAAKAVASGKGEEYLKSEEFKGTMVDVAKSDAFKEVAGDVAGDLGVADMVEGALDNDLGEALQSEDLG